jgi:hypothetical protein
VLTPAQTTAALAAIAHVQATAPAPVARAGRLMGNFWTDLNRHLAQYEAAEAADEAAREEFGEDYAETVALDPEDRDLISEDDIRDTPDHDLARTA